MISIHALLAESDTSKLHKILADWDFYPRSPCGERRHSRRPNIPNGYISIHALLAESDQFRRQRPRRPFISIHALLAESDAERLCNALEHLNFYPRSPCGERRKPSIQIRHLPKFLSTLSLRRATDKHAQSPKQPEISIHALLAESDPRTGLTCGGGQIISIHALLAESDIDTSKDIIETINFYPRSPCGERPPVRDVIQWEGIFLSTLSLRRATPRP